MLKLLKISGYSLTPDYRDGDFVLVSKVPFLFRPPQSGDVVAFRRPPYGTLIKRVKYIDPDGGLFVIGTHNESVDSREFGEVSQDALIGKVIWHVRNPRTR
jgi:phage repressor protein C with HTH and peptisase S24 domain